MKKSQIKDYLKQHLFKAENELLHAINTGAPKEKIEYLRGVRDALYDAYCFSNFAITLHGLPTYGRTKKDEPNY